MKIAWIMNGCGLNKIGISGGEIRFSAISSRWINKGNNEQLIITTSGGIELLKKVNLEDKLTKYILPASLFVKTEPFKAFRFYSYIISSIVSKIFLRKFPEVDVIIPVSDYFCDIIPAFFLKKKYPNAKLIVWIHHRYLPPKNRPGNKIVNWLMYTLQGWGFKKIMRYADEAWTYITDSGDLIDSELKQLGINVKKIHKMKCGMDIKDVPDENITKKVDAVMIGVMPNKGMYDIIPVWKEVIKHRPGTTLKLMGRTHDAIYDIIDEAGLRNEISVFKPSSGYVDTVTFYKMIKEARIMFAPSKEEGWGIAVCEAMACGLPVVGYDLPVYKKIYGDNFIKIPIGDTMMFAESICKVLDSKEEYDNNKEKGFKCAKQYDWDLVADEDWEYINGI